ncbi:MAG TPA: glycosyltransferase [Kribbella sp.]|nr:glycosyltransferase [Kribbella sp.]
MKVLMLVQSAVAGDSRVLREATALAEAGHEVHLIGRDVPEGFEVGPGITAESAARSAGLRYGQPGQTAASRPPGLGTVGLRMVRWLLLPEHRRRTEWHWRTAVAGMLAGSKPYEVVHAHDFNTLELAVELADRWSATLVYDSHELWFDRALPGRPSPLWRARGRRRESRLARRAAMVLTVSDGIARRLRDRGLPDVRVIRNTFPRLDRPPNPPSEPVALLYAGRIGAGRDLDAVVAAAERLAPIRTVLMGSIDLGYRLDRRTVETAEPTSIEGVDRALQEYGISLVTLTDGCENHRLALPNKLFHAVRAGVPVVAADLPELRTMVTRYRLGTLYRPGDASALVDAVRTVVVDYEGYLDGVRAAAYELSWEHDSQALVAAYAELGAP